MTLRLGIGVATQNHRDSVAVTLSRIQQHTRYPATRIAVADDGSDDRTLAMLRGRSICTVGGRPMGAGWNNNRVLFLLRQVMRCDIIILLSDDIFPVADGWEAAWMQAAVRWGHAGLAAEWLRDSFVSGSGSLDDPVRSTRTSWTCHAYTRETLDFGGYFDPRCHDRAAAHTEHAARLARLGYGGSEELGPDGSARPIFKLLRSTMGVTVPRPADDGPAAGQAPDAALMNDRAYRAPWRDEAELRQFRDEMRELVQAQGDLVRDRETRSDVPGSGAPPPDLRSPAEPPRGVAPPVASGAPELYQIFLDRTGRTRQVHRWHHYFPIFERVLGLFRGKPVTLLEIGVYQGGSLQMWRAWLGPQARLVGIDTDPKCAAFAFEGAQVFIGDQADPEFLRRVLAEVGDPDIVIDDGGHTATEQITSFETLYPALRHPGVYLVEDTHTAFWRGQYDDRYDGISFMDYAFDRCRSLHEWTMRRASFQRYGTPPEQRLGYHRPVSEFCRRTGSISFHDSIVVFERAERSEPWHEHR